MLQTIALTRHFGDHVALSDLNLIVNKGEIFCLLGQNGAGKTTTINLLLGFTEPTSGTARINGVEVTTKEANTRKMVAYIPEVVMLYPNLTGVENLDFFSRLAGFRYESHALENFLAEAGLQSESMNKRLGNYSKGMRQKVGIAIALAKEAELLLMDEPTSGLDPKATAEFTQLVKHLGEKGKSVLMATHDIFNAVNVGTAIGIMKQGKLVHSLHTRDITAQELQRLYLETI